MKVELDPDGTVRHLTTLERIGRWFKQDETIYYIKDKEYEQRRRNHKEHVSG